MTQLQRILMAILAIFGRLFTSPDSAAQGKVSKVDKVGGFNFLPALCVVFVFGFLTACGGFVPIKYYNYKSGESNFYAAQSICRGKAIAAAPPLKQLDRPYRTGLGILIIDNSAERNNAINVFYEQCITQAGWLPCSQGGQGNPQCACLNPGPDGKPTCR